MAENLLRDSCSYHFEEISQRFCGDQAFRQAADNLQCLFGQSVSVDTLERIPRRMAGDVAEFFDTRPVPAPADESELLVVSADGKGVPMIVEPIPARPVGTGKADRPGNRTMATVGAIYSVNRYVRTPDEIVATLFRDPSDEGALPQPVPVGKQLRVEFTEFDPDAELTVPGAYPIMYWLAAQAALRDPHGHRPLIRLLDGQVSLRDTGDVFLDNSQFTQLIDILDIVDVAGYVWQLAHVFYSTGSRDASQFARDQPG